MARLPENIRAEIVMRLAEFESPAEVRDYLREEHELDVGVKQIWHYNPERSDAQNNSGGGTIAAKWVELFNEHREKFLRRTADIGIANKAFRLQRLDRMARKAERMRNYKLAAELHEQAAKEMGGYFTNTHNLNVDVRTMLAQLIGVRPDELPSERGRHLNAAEELRALASGNGARGNGKAS